MWRMRTITILFGLWIVTSVLFGQGTNEHPINTYYGCDVPLDCRGRDGVWYHSNRSISNTSLQSVRFDDAGHYQCKTPSDAVLDEFTLHVYGLQGVAALNCSSVSNSVCVRNVMREQPVTLCATFTTFPSSVSEKYTSNLLDITRSRWEVSSNPLVILVCRSEDNCSGDPAYHFHADLKWRPCVTVTNVTEDITFSYVINTRKVAADVCPAPTSVVQRTAEFSIHVLDTLTVETTSIISSSSSSLSTSSSSHPSAVTPTVETTSIISSSSSSLSTSSSSHASAITNTPVTTPSPNPGTGSAVAAIVPIMVIIVTVVAMVLFVLIAGMMCRTRGGRDCSSVEDDKDNILDLRTKKKSSRSSLGPVIYAVSESTMEQLHISHTGEDAGYGNTVSNHSTPMDDAITEHSLTSMGTCTIPPITGSPPHEHSQTVRPDSLRIKGERKVDSGVSLWTSPSGGPGLESNPSGGPGLESNPSGGPGLKSNPSGGPGLESSPSGGPGLDSNLSDKPLLPGDSDDVSENDFTEGFYTNVPKT